jgi:molybdopterin-guanine dinucleotide biosynthesis protein A
MTNAVLLTGGRSARHGNDKASVAIEGRTVLERMLAELDRARVQVTVLGADPVEGRAFQRDEHEHAGPAAALKRFRPTTEIVFVASCDLPLFRAETVAVLKDKIHGNDAAIPKIAGRPQYLCALYTRSAFEKWATTEGNSMQDLVNAINAIEVSESELEESGVDPRWVRGFNTPEELADLLRER